ncbi:MAG: CRISPR-associated protein Cas4 [Caldilinea sp.]|jgi:CRISPR-associated exonuclease Cas4|nr:CRISPR-associated protein Cas4 [Caldilinea sp.]
MTEMDSSDLLPISYLNQYVYCARRFWYTYVEGEKQENEHTVQGVLNHERVHTIGQERSEPGVLLRRSVHVYSSRLGLSGICDLVEEREGGALTPVEYKQGKRGRWRNDHAQLCAQALCLEEMTGCRIEQGFLFYFSERRREEVAFTAELRAFTVELVQRIRDTLARGERPPHTEQPARCKGCSLYDICLPVESRFFQSAGSA